MRLLKLIMGDVAFQWRYGFYAVYAIFTAVYLLALTVVPQGARGVVASVMIFTDPAAMGLFFMGAIVLLEKSQRVNCAIAVSPARVWEYCLAKLVSLAVIGLVVALIIALAAGLPDIASCLLSVALASVLCSACGLIAAMKCRSLNQFVLFSVPFELFIFLPPALLLFGFDSPIMAVHPGVAAIWLILAEAPNRAFCIISLAIWAIAATCLCARTVKRGFLQIGGEGI